MRANPYPSDLTDAQFEILQPQLPIPKHRGRPLEVDLREVLNAIFYVNRTGCQWRALPRDFPKKSTVNGYYNQWRKDGTWDLWMQLLREKVRKHADKEPTPSMVIIDSQSVKGTELGGEHGIDAHKKINGRKRHILVDTLGLVVAVLVTSAAVQDGAAAPALMAQLSKEDYPRLQKLLADDAYSKFEFPRWVREHGFYVLEISKKPPPDPDDPNPRSFKVIKWRWIVERTFAWLGRYRRHSKDYERLPQSSESMIAVSSIHRMLRVLKSCNTDPPFKYPKPA
jgi:putative transposase